MVMECCAYVSCSDQIIGIAANQNRFEGKWVNDKKNGRGKYFFLGTGQLMEGIWVDDVPKCCQMADLGRELAPERTPFEIPEIKLEDPNAVLRETQEKLLEQLSK
ncbi:MORN repeat-containing protein 3 [Clonorchis sinensis]|nr:MORN repeat-containing protein 3 [Clonorchis sinensis]